MISSATAVAHPNIAFIKYWGNKDQDLRIPANGSLSMNLKQLETRTSVSFDPSLVRDQLILNGNYEEGVSLKRVATLLDRVRNMVGFKAFASVESENNFPTGTGIASSASAFAALSYASSTAAGLCLSERELSQLARTGSGSASRSIPGGFVEWQAGTDHDSSFAFSIAEPIQWDLTDQIVLISREHKKIGSSQGHTLADTSPIQEARVKDAKRRLDICRKALLERDFPTFADIVEQDCNLMHAVMMTSVPPLNYWLPGTLEVMRAVQFWRREGIQVCYTIDAGPNVHVICPTAEADIVKENLNSIDGVNSILECTPGGPACLLEPDLPGV
ncbi:MAG: diphosphomevalonate decarboxylase [Anaerolineales bacterium]|nr:diphosphomevalonate decarboxylase [Anaerolineales bacterium]